MGGRFGRRSTGPAEAEIAARGPRQLSDTGIRSCLQVLSPIPVSTAAKALRPSLHYHCQVFKSPGGKIHVESVILDDF